MSVNVTEHSPKSSPRPWYREPWAWMVLAPLILVVIASTVFVSIAVRFADDTVSDTYYKDSRMYHFSEEQDRRAQALGLAGLVKFASGDQLVTLELNGDLEYPEQLLLTLSHPVEADMDRHILLEAVSPGRYRASLPEPLKHRWYLRLMPETDPGQHLQAEWRLKGEINFDLGDAAPLTPAR
nr:FixH family protein [Microbulbifer zhoushanensis]